LNIVASSDGWDYQKHAIWYFEKIRHDASGLEELFEEEIDQTELISTFERLAKNRSLPVKILVHYKL